MKKKLLLMLFLLTLVGCSNQPAEAPKEEAQVEAEESTKEENVEEAKEESPKPSMKEKKEIIPLGERYSGENLELEVYGYQWTNLIEPVKKASFYSYYENKNPDTAKYIRIDGKMKNKFPETVNLEGFAYKVIINDKYNYILSTTYEEAGDLATLVYLDPLQEKDIIIFGEIPNEAIESIETITLKFGYNDNHNNMFDSLESKRNIIEFELKEVENAKAISENQPPKNSNNKPEIKTAENISTTDSEYDDSNLIGLTTQITAGQVNVRSGPGLSNEVIGNIYKDDYITIFDTYFNDNRTWCKIDPVNDAWISINVINGSIK